MEDNKALVIGGGVAGVQCAITLSKNGVDVYLVEEKPWIGGWGYLSLEPNGLTFPGPFVFSHDVKCLIPLGLSSSELARIDMYMPAHVLDITRSGKSFNVTLKVYGRGVSVERCNLCGECEKTCPVKVDGKKAINLRPFSYPYIYAVNRDVCTRCRKCEASCPEKAIRIEEVDEEHLLKLSVNLIVIATGQVERENHLAMKSAGRVISLTSFLEYLAGYRELGFKPRKVFLTVEGREGSGVNVLSYFVFKAALTAVKNNLDVIVNHEKLPKLNLYTPSSLKPLIDEIVLVRGSVSSLKEDPQKITVKTDRGEEFEVDLVVVAGELAPSKGTEYISRLIGLARSKDGFIKPVNGFYSETRTPVDQVYVCGAAKKPMALFSSVVDGILCAHEVLLGLYGGAEKVK